MTTVVKDMLDTYPAALGGVDRERPVRCIDGNDLITSLG